MTIRDELSAAADAVAGIECTPLYRQTTETGHAFVKLDRTEYPNRLGGVEWWQVYVMLPADRAEAEQFFEDKKRLLYAALSERMTVKSIRQQDTVFEPGGPALPTLVVEGHEAEE